MATKWAIVTPPPPPHRIYPKQSCSRACFSNHAAHGPMFPMCSNVFLCAAGTTGSFNYNAVLYISFQNSTACKTIPVAVQPVPFASHLLSFPLFSFHDQDKTTALPCWWNNWRNCRKTPTNRSQSAWTVKIYSNGTSWWWVPPIPCTREVFLNRCWNSPTIFPTVPLSWPLPPQCGTPTVSDVICFWWVLGFWTDFFLK